jgi:hypothetical protein
VRVKEYRKDKQVQEIKRSKVIRKYDFDFDRKRDFNFDTKSKVAADLE